MEIDPFIPSLILIINSFKTSEENSFRNERKKFLSELLQKYLPPTNQFKQLQEIIYEK